MPEIIVASPSPAYQFGHGQYLYLGHDNMADGNGVFAPQPLTSLIADAGAITVNTVNWSEYSTLRDVSFDGSPNTVDTTTRKEARLGNASQAIATTTRTRSLQIRYAPNESYALANDILYRLLVKAEKLGTEIPIMELDATMLTDGAFGFASNCTVSLSQPKPVQDIVVVDVTATISTYGEYIIANGTTGTGFEGV